MSLPTDEQTHNFADFVAHAHSWYKHLPLFPTGVKFYFFIDKNAAHDRVTLDNGRTVIRERSESGLHYSTLPTKEYRRRFGPLRYAVRAPALVHTLQTTGNAVTVRLPPDILQCGTARLTAAIHTLSGSRMIWTAIAEGFGGVDWPEESGGRKVLEKILKRSRELGTALPQPRGITVDKDYVQRCPEAAHYLYGVDPVLHELLLPERERQYKEIVTAIHRVCQFVERERCILKSANIENPPQDSL